MTSLRVYSRLTLTTFSIAYENLNRTVLFPRFHSDAEIEESNEKFEEELNEFINLVKSLKEGRDWWNTCSDLQAHGYHSEVNEALLLVS